MSTEIERIAAATLILARHGVPADVQELLVRGDGRGTVPPGALAAVISYARKAALEEAARVAESCSSCPFNTCIATAIRALIERESEEG